MEMYQKIYKVLEAEFPTTDPTFLHNVAKRIVGSLKSEPTIIIDPKQLSIEDL
jgi:hypothetical protein